MADYVVKGESLTAVAEAIREKTGETEAMGLSQMPEKVGTVYDAGKQAEYDAFWDAFQQNGARTEYRYAFSYAPWTDVNFKPKYPLKVVGDATNMFTATTFEWADQVLEVDFSEATSVSWSFRNNRMHHIGKCDFSSVIGNVYQTFSMCPNLQSIEEIVSHEGLGWSAPFASSTNLETLKISGVIGKNGFDVSPCPLLTHDSLMSILNALKDYADSGSTYSVTLGTANLAKLTDEEKMIAIDKGWTLVGWTPPVCSSCGAPLDENGCCTDMVGPGCDGFSALYCACGAPLDENGNCTDMNGPACVGWEEE